MNFFVYERLDKRGVKMEARRVTIVIIATKHYAKYLFQLLDSMPREIEKSISVRFLIFTDNPNLVAQNLSQRKDLNFELMEIPSYGWPEATLFRYELISYGSYLEDELIAYLDADSRVMFDEFISNLFGEKEKISLVKHPGFAWPSIGFFIRNPMKSLIRVAHLLITGFREGGFGTWEKEPHSLAYVKPENRKDYFCGGLWWGPQGPILDMCSQLSRRIRLDYEKGVIARWHDESHLNWYAANNLGSVSKIPSSVCFSPSISVSPRKLGWVEAIDK